MVNSGYMAAMGVIGCTVLSDELAYLVRRDPEINRVVMVDNPDGRVAVDKLKRTGACESIWLVDSDEIEPPISRTDQLICWMNPSDLHNSQERTRATLSLEVAMMAPLVDCILLLYGQCRCQTLDVDQLQAEVGVPLIFLCERHNGTVDDCICATLGCRERYLNAMKMHKGAIFATPGYVEDYFRQHQVGDIVHMVEEIEELRAILQYAGRPPILKLETPLEPDEEYELRLDLFVRTFDLDVLTLTCDLEVFEESYDWAKSVMKEQASKKATTEACEAASY